MKLARRNRAGTMIAHVARIFAVGNHLEAFRPSERLQFGKEFVFAKVTSIDRILQVIGVREFVGVHHPDRKTKVPSHFESLVQLASGQAW